MANNLIQPRMSDEAVESKTGKTWARWFKQLDAAGAKKMTHQEIVALLHDKHAVPPWWTQMIAVTYEQARGLREKHEKPDGYEISVSRTIKAPVTKAFKAWIDENTRKKWLPANLTIRKATTNKTLRISWEDGKTSVSASFLPGSSDRCQVVTQHMKLPDAKAAARMKGFWSDKLDGLKEMLEG